MNCQSVQESFSLYLYGELDFQTEEMLEQHLAQCPACAAVLEREREWHAAARDITAETPMALLARCRRDLSRSLRFMDSSTAAQPLGACARGPRPFPVARGYPACRGVVVGWARLCRCADVGSPAVWAGLLIV